MDEETRIVLYSIIIFVVVLLSLPVVYIVTNKLLKRSIQRGRLDENKLTEFCEKLDKVQSRRRIIRRFIRLIGKNVLSAVLIVMFGISMKDFKVVLVAIVPIVYILFWIYICKKKG